jgi:hypothetical protein
MITYQTLSERIYRVLSDVGQKQHDTELVWDGAIAAHDAILQWVPYFKSVTLTSGSAGAPLDLFQLPDDVYQVDTIQTLSDGQFYPRATFAPNTVRNTGQQSEILDWIEYPTGYVNTSENVPEGEQIKVYYRAYWPTPPTASSNSFQILVPKYAHTGMVYYAAAHCLLPRSVGAGGIRQFNDKSDSGVPTDNPLYNMSEWFLKRFMQEMKLMPSFAKVGF